MKLDLVALIKDWLKPGPAQTPMLYQSLRIRLTLWVTVVLTVILTGFLAFHYRQHRDRTVREAETTLVNIGQLITSTMEHAMLTRDHTELQQIMNSIARQNDIRYMVLLNKESVIRFAPEGKDVGKPLTLSDPGCQICHRRDEPTQGGTVSFTTLEGEPVLRNCTPIPNKTECYRCHSPQNAINGALITDFSMTDLNQHLADELQTNMLGGLTVMLTVGLLVNLLLDRLVLRRLELMMLAIYRFGVGDRTQRMTVYGDDEINRLATAFNQMADGLDAREREAKRLHHELQQKEALRAHLLHQIIQVQEDERKRIARDLHDDFAQTLTALTISLETTLQTLPNSFAALGRQLARVKDLTMTTLGLTHRWIQDLRPRLLDDLGLIPAIRWYAETRMEAVGVQVQLEVSGFRGRLPAELETTLFRVIQEALNNIAKHAHAKHVRIRLETYDARVVAEVEDDGVGFDPQEFLTMRDDMRGIGLLGMRERMTLVGGALTVVSRPGQGTRIRIEAPWTA